MNDHITMMKIILSKRSMVWIAVEEILVNQFI